jgi:hypothetical protein
MGDPLVHQLRQCCLRGMGECPGCGFFIAPHLIITCGHVVGPDTPIGSEILLHQWGDATITHLSSTLIALFPTEDIAVLETPDPGPTFAPFSAEVSLGQRLTALGFPLKGSQPTFDQLTAIDFEIMQHGILHHAILYKLSLAPLGIVPNPGDAVLNMNQVQTLGYLPLLPPSQISARCGLRA